MMDKNSLCIEVIKKISYRKNVILLEFNKDMDVVGEHSFLIPKNYAIKKENIMKLLSRGISIKVVKKGYIIRIVLPSNSNYLNDKCKLNLGYIFRNKIFYIESKEGIVDFPYNIKEIGKETEELSLENGECYIINNSSLKYYYKGKNEFSYVDVDDFYIEKDNRIYFPKSMTINNKKEIIFNFKDGVFWGENKSVYLKTKSIPKSKDVYNFSIAKNSSIKIIDKKFSYVESLSFSNYENNKAYLKIKFSKPLLKFNGKDFKVKYNNEIYDIEFLGEHFNKTVIDVVINNITVKNFIRGIFKLFMTSKYEEVETIDYLGEKVFVKGEISSRYFSSKSISWELPKYDLKDSIINIEFKEDIVPSSIITNSNFDSEIKFWNSRILVIPPGKIILSYNNNSQVLSLSNNQEFGKIVISFKNKLIYNEQTAFNNEPAILYLICNKLFIKFDKLETLNLNSLEVENIKYYPGSNIKCVENYFIFYGYHPTGKLNILQNIINLKPIKNELENPFKGGIIKASYILNVDNENKYRTYGNYDNVTIIDGFLKIMGTLKFNEIIFIKNLKITGKVYVNIGSGSIELNGLECNDLVYN